MKFNDWLLEKLKELDWSQADLARASGLTRAAISRYINDYARKPDEDALRKIAKALHMAPETVFRAAGVLPPAPTEDPWVVEMNHKISILQGARREMAERLLNALLEEQEKESKNAAAKSQPRHSHA